MDTLPEKFHIDWKPGAGVDKKKVHTAFASISNPRPSIKPMADALPLPAMVDSALHLAASSGGYELSFMLERMYNEGMIKPGISTQDWVDFKQDLKDAGLKVKTEIPVDLDYKQIHTTRYTYDPTNHESAEDHLDFTVENDKHAPASTLFQRVAHHAITNGQYKLAEDVLEVMHIHDESLNALDVCIDKIER